MAPDPLLTIVGNEPEMKTWIGQNKRESLRIIVKLFLYDEEQSAIEDAIEAVCNQLETNYLDTLTLSLPSKGKELTRDRIRRVWSNAEQAIHYNVKDLGMSDLDPDQLIDLYSFSTVKPTNNQINLELCCSIPEKMSEFAHEHGIKLLTHGDPVGKTIYLDLIKSYASHRLLSFYFHYLDFLPQDKFRELLKDCKVNAVTEWKRLWVARYIVIQEHRGVVLCKGYLLSCQRN